MQPIVTYKAIKKALAITDNGGGHENDDIINKTKWDGKWCRSPTWRDDPKRQKSLSTRTHRSVGSFDLVILVYLAMTMNKMRAMNAHTICTTKKGMNQCKKQTVATKSGEKCANIHANDGIKKKTTKEKQKRSKRDRATAVRSEKPTKEREKARHSETMRFNRMAMRYWQFAITKFAIWINILLFFCSFHLLLKINKCKWIPKTIHSIVEKHIK